MKTRILIILCIIGLAGCGTKITNIEATGYANQYQVKAEGDSVYVAYSRIYHKAESKAKEQCKLKKKKYHKLKSQFIPGGIGAWPEVIIDFECNNNLIDTKQKIVILDKKDISLRLKQLNNLYIKKLITKEEYNTKRNSILDNL